MYVVWQNAFLDSIYFNFLNLYNESFEQFVLQNQDSLIDPLLYLKIDQNHLLSILKSKALINLLKSENKSHRTEIR